MWADPGRASCIQKHEAQRTHAQEKPRKTVFIYFLNSDLIFCVPINISDCVIKKAEIKKWQNKETI